MIFLKEYDWGDNMPADLHIHTTVSDGTDTPVDILNKALNLGLKAIAITDHDIMEGAVVAQQQAKGKNIEVLAGVEISCYYQEREVHVLGYFNNIKDSELSDTLAEMREFRLVRAWEMVNRLKRMGIDIRWKRVRQLAGEGSIGRPHVADALVEQGYIPNRESAFKKYIGYGCPAYVPRKKMSPVEAIELIGDANGIAVLAHPGIINKKMPFKDLMKHGLKGIEVWHPHHSSLQTQYFLNLTQKLGLIPTGGSDYHGTKHASCNSLGLVTAPMETVVCIKEILTPEINPAKTSNSPEDRTSYKAKPVRF